jgi:hypothetical protein
VSCLERHAYPPSGRGLGRPRRPAPVSADALPTSGTRTLPPHHTSKDAAARRDRDREVDAPRTPPTPSRPPGRDRVGAEDEGLPAAWLEAAAQTVSIPVAPGSADSLNAATAAAVILFEAVRQRG